MRSVLSPQRYLWNLLQILAKTKFAEETWRSFPIKIEDVIADAGLVIDSPLVGSFVEDASVDAWGRPYCHASKILNKAIPSTSLVFWLRRQTRRRRE